MSTEAQSTGQQMRAVTFAAYGDSDVLEVSEVPRPSVGAGEIGVKVILAGVNPFDVKVRSGAMADVMALPLPAIPGLEFAGVVDEVGDGVGDVEIGARVVGWGAGHHGTYAEFSVARVYVPIPDDLSYQEAVTVPVAGDAAARAVGEVEVVSDDVVVIHGASGGVGSIAVGLALDAGATVIGTASARNQDFVASLGAIPVLNGEGMIDRIRAATPRPVTAACDLVGNGVLPQLVALCGSARRVVTIADPGASDLGVTFSGSQDEKSRRETLARNLELLEEGTIITRVADVYELDEAANAQDLSSSGHAGGKVLITPISL
ncbi:NADP-dependent oxidoreductase [Gordonia jinhuaensis]|uniref:Oxidoreductase n=1 Tax=Gordonia jinhuaensis TaxID=1517702 RepID=A0A916T7T3_9ACTN|nr:NADP-dependent oxidoreductase [Gordonia jinhuaensis]GGB35152.1 oxidoreductase [Gordonia jinhuaensis]